MSTIIVDGFHGNSLKLSEFFGQVNGKVDCFLNIKLLRCG